MFLVKISKKSGGWCEPENGS